VGQVEAEMGEVPEQTERQILAAEAAVEVLWKMVVQVVPAS